MAPHLGTVTTTLPNLPETTTEALTGTSTTSTVIGLDKLLSDTPITMKHQMSSDSIGNKLRSPQQGPIRHDTRTSTGVTTPHRSTSTVSMHLLKEPTDNLHLDQDNLVTLEMHRATLPVVTPTTTVSVLIMPTPTT